MSNPFNISPNAEARQAAEHIDDAHFSSRLFRLNDGRPELQTDLLTPGNVERAQLRQAWDQRPERGLIPRGIATVPALGEAGPSIWQATPDVAGLGIQDVGLEEIAPLTTTVPLQRQPTPPTDEASPASAVAQPSGLVQLSNNIAAANGAPPSRPATEHVAIIANHLYTNVPQIQGRLAELNLELAEVNRRVSLLDAIVNGLPGAPSPRTSELVALLNRREALIAERADLVGELARREHPQGSSGGLPTT